MTGRPLAPLCLLLGIALTGCATPPQPVYLPVEANEYHRAFDAAEEVARSYGLVPALRDRRAGVLETDPVIAGSILEPWDRATKSLEQAMESTLSFQRRRARFEFQPAGSLSADAERPQPTADGLPGADLLALERSVIDLTRIDGPLELRVWVYVERAHVPGIRRSTWSRRMTSRAQVIDPATSQPLGSAWTVVSRDRALETHLLEKVARSLERSRSGDNAAVQAARLSSDPRY